MRLISTWSARVSRSRRIVSSETSKRALISVTEMSARFEVSLDTIRRDLDTLADQVLISRIHGGAVPIDGMASADSPFEQRINAHQIAKTNIGRAAALLISSG